MKTIVKRASAKTPPFFKRLRNFGMAVSAIGATLIGLQQAVPAIEIPAIVVTIGSYMIACGLVIASICQLPVNNE